MTRKLKLKTRKNKETKEYIPEFKYKKKRWLAIILKENKGIITKWISYKKDMFRADNNTYFAIPEGVYLSSNKILVSVYLEGISTPFTHKNVEKEEIKRKIIDKEGNEITIPITVIKGLKYDSKVIDMILNRGMANEFTKQHMDTPMIILYILVFASIIMGLANLVVSLS